MSFTGDTATGYRANLWLRSAIRVLMLLQETMLEGRRPAGEEVRQGGAGKQAAGAEMEAVQSNGLQVCWTADEVEPQWSAVVLLAAPCLP